MPDQECISTYSDKQLQDYIHNHITPHTIRWYHKLDELLPLSLLGKRYEKIIRDSIASLP